MDHKPPATEDALAIFFNPFDLDLVLPFGFLKRPFRRCYGKARGVKLGRHGAEILAAKDRNEALDRAKQLEPVMREMQSKGYSMRRMATELTKRKVKTSRGGRWHPQTRWDAALHNPASVRLEPKQEPGSRGT